MFYVFIMLSWLMVSSNIHSSYSYSSASSGSSNASNSSIQRLPINTFSPRHSPQASPTTSSPRPFPSASPKAFDLNPLSRPSQSNGSKIPGLNKKAILSLQSPIILTVNNKPTDIWFDEAVTKQQGSILYILSSANYPPNYPTRVFIFQKDIPLMINDFDQMGTAQRWIFNELFPGKMDDSCCSSS